MPLKLLPSSEPEFIDQDEGESDMALSHEESSSMPIPSMQPSEVPASCCELSALRIGEIAAVSFIRHFCVDDDGDSDGDEVAALDCNSILALSSG
mmetsp:Transcript_863/g.1775  ORF Transcript_863/g.1775 Transcript_863/m.1775 type:complete len:95 (+) Transcript_863:2373-2657(+)